MTGLRGALLVALLAPVGALSCTPVPLLQGAETLSPGSEDRGVGVFTVVPLREGASIVPVQNAEVEEVHQKPLPSLVGWYRRGMGVGEVQAAFQVPAFTMAVGYKVAFLGGSRSDTVSLAVSADMSWSPMLGAYGTTGSLHATFRPDRTYAIELLGRFGTFPGLWKLPALMVGGGVAIGERLPWRIQGGALIDPGTGGTPGAWLGIGRGMSSGP